MIAGSVARRYAKALLEIAAPNKSADALGREVERLAAVVHDSPALSDALANPVFKLSQRRMVLDDVVKRLVLSRPVRNFALLLLDRGRIGALAAIAREFRTLVDESVGRVRVVVTTARAIDPGAEARLKTALEKKTGKTVLIERREDASLIGGLVAQVGDTVYDGSVRTQLENLRAQLLAE